MKRYNHCYIGGKIVWQLEINSNDSKQTLTVEGDLPKDYPMNKAIEKFKGFVQAWMYIDTHKKILRHYGSWTNAILNMRKITARYKAPQKVTYEFEDEEGFISEEVYRKLKRDGCPKSLVFGVLSIYFTQKECVFECSHKIEMGSLEQDELLFAFIKYPFLTDICQQNQIYRLEIGTSLKKIVFDREDYSLIYCEYFNSKRM